MGQMKNSQESAIRVHYLGQIDEDTHALIRLATADLYTGPIDREAYPEYPGFVTACARIRDAVDLRRDVWVSDWDDVVDTEPDWCDGTCGAEECTGEWSEDWTYYDSRHVRRIVLGALAEYV